MSFDVIGFSNWDSESILDEWYSEKLSRPIFNHIYRDKSKVDLLMKRIVDGCPQLNIFSPQRSKALKLILLDLFVRDYLSESRGNIGIFTSKTGNGSASHPQYKTLGVNGYIVKELTLCLSECKFVHFQVGVKGHSTKIRASKKLKTIFDIIGMSIDEIGCVRRFPIVLYRFDKIKENMEVEKAEEYGLRILYKYNSLISNSEITVGNKPLYKFEKFIFRLIKEGGNNDLVHYGRLHGAIWQNIESNARNHIKINGFGCSEVDICSTFPAIAYALNNLDITIAFNKGRHAYELDVLDTTIKNERDLAKLVLLCLLNAKDKQSAIKGLRKKINEGKLKYSGEIDLEVIVDKMIAKHIKIDNWFFNSSWKELSKYESNICMKVIEYFTNKDILVLPIHDSFIIQSKHIDELKSVLEQSMRVVCDLAFKFPSTLWETKVFDPSFGITDAELALVKSRTYIKN